MRDAEKAGKPGHIECNTIMWWAKLVVAVLAVPSVGIIVSFATHTKGFFAVAIFIVTCWICTYLGMLLMKHQQTKD